MTQMMMSAPPAGAPPPLLPAAIPLGVDLEGRGRHLASRDHRWVPFEGPGSQGPPVPATVLRGQAKKSPMKGWRVVSLGAFPRLYWQSPAQMAGPEDLAASRARIAASEPPPPAPELPEPEDQPE